MNTLLTRLQKEADRSDINYSYFSKKRETQGYSLGIPLEGKYLNAILKYLYGHMEPRQLSLETNT